MRFRPMPELPSFPTDDHTLDLLWSAIHPDPTVADKSDLYGFLQWMSQLAGSDVTAVAEEINENTVVLRDPQYHHNSVISALISEVRRQRRELRATRRLARAFAESWRHALEEDARDATAAREALARIDAGDMPVSLQALEAEFIGADKSPTLDRSTVMVDPWHKFGMPRIGHVRVVDLVDLLVAPEPGDVVCEEFGVSRADLLLACWFEAHFGRPSRRKAFKGWLGRWETKLGKVDAAEVPLPTEEDSS